MCMCLCLSETSNLYTSFLSMGMDSKDMLLRALECRIIGLLVIVKNGNNLNVRQQARG